MENQDRNGGNTLIVDPSMELEIKELMEAGFFRAEALDLLTLYRDIPDDQLPEDEFDMHLAALRNFQDGLVAPTAQMRDVLTNHKQGIYDRYEENLRAGLFRAETLGFQAAPPKPQTVETRGDPAEYDLD